MGRAPNVRLPDDFIFNPKWWWDPVPPWLNEHLTIEVARDLAKIQLEKQARVLELEQTAVKQMMQALEKIR